MSVSKYSKNEDFSWEKISLDYTTILKLVKKKKIIIGSDSL